MNNENAAPTSEESSGAQRVSMAHSGQNEFPIKKHPGQQPLQETGSDDTKRAMNDAGETKEDSNQEGGTAKH
ncbi:MULTISPECIES: hypothetical protein [Hymenobacter]|uniref:Uncharacterized protein n=1 Tax=Hymenobacter cavernae TaxID=2044852 RepID=A0ABQ1TI37_9BACT|nr:MULTISPECIES: hypothetical protein [Hymenobacter]WRQ29929.1 hypothetical protein SD425_06575 [Hymenobacter sp. GOD-10R]GGE93955.1 hypothetical protein GCM10011383_00780 [Hymenobacter cavernae]